MLKGENNKLNSFIDMSGKRGRPLGSKNKASGSNVRLINFDKQIENAPIIKKNIQYDIIQYGSRNTYPYDLISLYNTSVTMRACVDFATNAIIGEGVDIEAMKLKDGDLQNPNYYTSWTEFIRALAFDFTLYSAFAFQIIRSRDGKSYTFYNQPVETVRLEEMDEDGVINNAYICKDWSAPSKYPPVKIPMFGFQQEKEIPIGVPYLFYHRQYNPVSNYYGLPTYSSALNAIQAEAQFQIHNYKTIVNGFCPIGALTLPDCETDEERQAMINNIQRLFTGAENSNSLLITFRTNVDDKPIDYTPFVQSSNNVNLYADATERTVNWIMAGFKIPSKALIGYPLDSLGFSDSSEYLESAFALYNVNIASGNRNEIMSVINNLFKMNGIDTQIILKPLNYRITDSSATTVSSEPTTETKTEDEVDEREDDTI